MPFPVSSSIAPGARRDPLFLPANPLARFDVAISARHISDLFLLVSCSEQQRFGNFIGLAKLMCTPALLSPPPESCRLLLGARFTVLSDRSSSSDFVTGVEAMLWDSPGGC